MTVNLNHGVVQGKVLSVTPFENNVRVNLSIADDYKDKNGQWVNRSYIVSVAFFGEAQMERVIRMAQKQSVVTIEYRLTSYIPKNSEYQTMSLTGINLHVAAEAQAAQDTSKPPRRAPAQKEEDVPW